MILLLFSIGIVPLLGAQDMDTLEGVYREQYEQLTAQENMLQEQIDNLTNMKAQVDSLIGQVGDIPAVDYAQEADRYRQLELLLPSATRYTQELARRQKQLTELQQQKTDLRSRILERQSSLPIWWRQ
jgi:peptidoglycan hydrolase CwlO-like protein